VERGLEQLIVPNCRCSTCGQVARNGECPDCRAGQAIVAGDPAASTNNPPSIDGDLTPSIRKLHDHSFLQILMWFFLTWAVIIALIVFFAATGI
jgi:hypothetical protein